MAKSNAVQLAQHVGAAITADGASGIITAKSFVGSGADLTGIDATSIKDSGGTIRAQAYTAGVTVTGVLTATSFDGDGSALTGLPAGLGTATAASGDGAVFYYTNNVLDIGSNLTLDSPSTAPVIYTQYSDLAVANGVDLTIADGDELVTDILGISTDGTTALSGTGGRVRTDTVTSRTTLSPVDFPSGITGVAATFTGNVTVGGTITYEDVQNVDSVGIVTAGKGFRATTGGIVVTAGVSTFTDAIDANGGANIAGNLLIGSNGSKIAENNVRFESGGAAYIDHATESQVINYRLSSTGGSALDTTALVVSPDGINVTGVSTATSFKDSKGALRSIPAKDQGGASEYTLIASDAGKSILRYGGGLTIPANILSEGDAVTIINASGSDITLTQGTSMTLYNTADASTGNRTLAGRGMATVWFAGGTTSYISGAGLS